MVEESICEYLRSSLLDIEEDRIRLLLSYSEEIPEFSEEEKKRLITAIDNIKIIDPACGSGAFPMGILHKLVYTLQKLAPDNHYWYELQYQKALRASEEVFKKSDKAEREELLREINEAFDDSINYPDFARKLYLIENCIYGVDIQPIAIQIAKLRFFISLVLDQKVDRNRENLGIRALPNLETKFVSANTLVGLERPTQFETGKLRNLKIVDVENKLKELRHKYFTAKTRTEKLRYQKKDKELREELAKLLINDGWDDKVARKIADYDLYDQNASAHWFDPEWMFGVRDGFDIVIANPPYIQLQKNHGQLAKLYKDKGYETFHRMGDVYCLFYEKGMQLLKDNGILCYISSNKWMRAGYGEKLRSFFLKYNPTILIDLGPGIFESATVDTNILLIQKAQNRNQLRAVTLQRQSNDTVDIKEQLNTRGVHLSKLTKDAWFIGSSAEQELKEKIERIGKPLKDWDVKIYYGIKTGLNKAFIIDTKKREEILNNCQTEEERNRTEAIIKPILRGRDIKRYYYEWAGLWVIVIPAGWTDENRDKTTPEKFISVQFSSLMKHLKQFEEKAQKRDDQGDYWWELRHCSYYPEFEKEKVVWTPVNSEYSFTIIPEKIYFNNAVFMVTNCPTKYFCALFNSKLIRYYLTFLFASEKTTLMHQKKQWKIFPFPPSPHPISPLLSKLRHWWLGYWQPKNKTPGRIPLRGSGR